MLAIIKLIGLVYNGNGIKQLKERGRKNKQLKLVSTVA